MHEKLQAFIDRLNGDDIEISAETRKGEVYVVAPTDLGITLEDAIHVDRNDPNGIIEVYAHDEHLGIYFNTEDPVMMVVTGEDRESFKEIWEDILPLSALK